MMYIDKAVESIKLAYMSHTPIVWLVTPTMETANDIAISFANEHFGGTRICVSIGKATEFAYKSLTSWEIGKSSTHASPCIYFDWRPRLNEEIKPLMNIFEEFVGLHQTLEIEENARTIIAENRQDAYLHSMIIIASPDTPDMGWLNRYIDVVYVGSMQDKEIEDTIRIFLENNNIDIDSSFIEQLVVNFRGVSEREMNVVLTKCLVSELFDYNCDEELKNNKDKILREIRLLKRQMLEGFKGLKWISIKDDDPHATGLDAITDWLKERQTIFSDPEKSVLQGYDIPKGILITGIPGTGKSLMAKQTARILKLPLVAMDLGDIQEGIVGKSEEHMGNALRMVDTMAPCVLWIDEIEKAFSGAESGQSDGGVMRRMFGKFLTWMQEKESFSFILATSNDITNLPPELFRSQRFDEKYYTFMPTAKECAKIFVANIRLQNERIVNSKGQKNYIFDANIFENESYWLNLLNTICTCNIDSQGNICPENVKLNPNGEWDIGYLPQKKLFTGADISAFVHNLKFKVLSQRRKEKSPNFGFSGPIKNIEVEKYLPIVLGNFIPYGQSNLKDIALCFRSLTKIRFKSASASTDNESVVRFSDYNELTEHMNFDSKRFSEDDSNYNRTLYQCIVGAINSISKENAYVSNRVGSNNMVSEESNNNKFYK